MFGFIKTTIKVIFNGNSTGANKEEKSDTAGTLTATERETVLQMVKHKKQEELNKHPTIAIIGITGVGKSTTINSLFGTKLGVGHFQSCTQKGTPIEINATKGKIILYDMPGLGEDEEKDEEHKLEYQKILPHCDVVLWITDISTREISSQQRYLKEILKYLEGRIVICCNKADKVHPDNWNTIINSPSEEQTEILQKRIADVRSKLCKVIPQLSEEVIVYYSADKHYNLDELFGAMLAASPKNRGWVIKDRIDLADRLELIDKDFLNAYKNGKRK